MQALDLGSTSQTLRSSRLCPATKIARHARSAAAPRKTSPNKGPFRVHPRETRPARGFHRHFREKVRPATGPLMLNREKLRPARHKTPIAGHFEHAGRTFSRSRPPSGRAGRTFSRTGRSHVATVKPPSPLLTPEQQPLKPTTPLRPKNAPKTAFSHPQRRRRFQMRLSMGEQRRWRFQMRLSMREQRRRRYPTTAWPVCGLRLRHQQVPMCPLLRKLARNSIG